MLVICNLQTRKWAAGLGLFAAVAIVIAAWGLSRDALVDAVRTGRTMAVEALQRKGLSVLPQ
jgi:hypothetical protein